MFEIVNDGRTDAGPGVSYKLTYEPLAQKGSGELIISEKSTLEKPKLPNLTLL